MRTTKSLEVLKRLRRTRRILDQNLVRFQKIEKDKENEVGDIFFLFSILLLDRNEVVSTIFYYKQDACGQGPKLNFNATYTSTKQCQQNATKNHKMDKKKPTRNKEPSTLSLVNFLRDYEYKTQIFPSPNRSISRAIALV